MSGKIRENLTTKLCNNSIDNSQARNGQHTHRYGSFPLDLSCGFSPIFFIRAWEKKAAHIAHEHDALKAHGLTIHDCTIMSISSEAPLKSDMSYANAGLKGTR